MSDVMNSTVASVVPLPAVVSFVCMSVIACVCAGVPTVTTGTQGFVFPMCPVQAFGRPLFTFAL